MSNDIEAYIAQIEHLLADARPVPLSASVMISRKDVEDVLADLRAGLPEELRQSRWILKERDELLEQATKEAERIVADAHRERERILSEEEVVIAARREAERILDDAREHCRVLRLEADDYIDAKLANFEVELHKELRVVEKGRERLRGRYVSDELAPDAGAPGLDADGGGVFDHELG